MIFKNKNVAIVGPATSLVGTGCGVEIDSFDLVVRHNNSYPVPTDLQFDYGSKCNVLFFNKFFINNFKSDVDFEKFGIHILEKSNIYKKNYLKKALGSIPLSGTVLIDYILSKSTNKIKIFGYDWYQEEIKWVPTYNDWREGVESGPHIPENDMRYLRNLMELGKIEITESSKKYLI